MAAWREFTWDYIAPGATVSVYIHGYAVNQAVAYSAVVFPQSGQAYYPLGDINMTQTEVFQHSDGTVARKVIVQNLASFNPCAVYLNILSENF
jgi:hypothetical protein